MGWNARRYFQQRGYTVISCSPQPERYRDYHSESLFLQMDVLEQNRVVEVLMHYRPQYVIHAAAYSTPMACERNPVRAQEINVVGTAHVFGAAAALRIPIVFLSTDLVFDGTGSWYRESDKANPQTIYGRTKFQAEAMLQEQNMFDQWIIIRSSLMFGCSPAWANGFPKFAETALCKGESVQLFLDQYRTPVFVDDVARAIDGLIGRELFGEIFHCGGAERLNRVEFVRRYCRAMDVPQEGIREVTMDDVPDYPTRVRDVSLLCDKLQRKAFWKPLPLEKAFEEMAAQKNQSSSAKEEE